MDDDDLEWLHQNREDLERLIQTRERWEWLARVTKGVATWLAVIGAGWIALRTGLSDFIKGPE